MDYVETYSKIIGCAHGTWLQTRVFVDNNKRERKITIKISIKTRLYETGRARYACNCGHVCEVIIIFLRLERVQLICV